MTTAASLIRFATSDFLSGRRDSHARARPKIATAPSKKANPNQDVDQLRSGPRSFPNGFKIDGVRRTLVRCGFDNAIKYGIVRSEEHTSELQSRGLISYA